MNLAHDGLAAAVPRKGWVVAVMLTICSFAAYTFVYFLRVPLFVPTWKDREVAGFDFKTVAAIAQIAGYAAGKFPSIYFIPRMPRKYWVHSMAAEVVLAAASVALVGVVPPAAAVVCVFTSSFFLSPIWSTLIRFLEGRNGTETIIAAVSLSYIAMSGIIRSISAGLIDAGYSNGTMLFITATVGAVGGVGSILGVNWVPSPSVADVKSRAERKSLPLAEGCRLLGRWGGVFGPVTLCYILLTCMRSFRDYFQTELLTDALGSDFDPSAFAVSESITAACVLIGIATMGLIENNRIALFAMLSLMVLGQIITIGATLLWFAGILPGFPLIIATGIGIFLAYVPPGAMLYDRLMAVSGEHFTTSFLILVSDFAGYIGTISLLCVKQTDVLTVSYAAFFGGMCLVGAGVCLVSLVLCMIYLVWRLNRHAHQRARLDSESLDHAGYGSAGGSPHCAGDMDEPASEALSYGATGSDRQSPFNGHGHSQESTGGDGGYDMDEVVPTAASVSQAAAVEEGTGGQTARDRQQTRGRRVGGTGQARTAPSDRDGLLRAGGARDKWRAGGVVSR